MDLRSTLLVLAACSHASPAAEETSVAADGRHLIEAFYAGRTQELWDRFDDGMRGVVRSKAGLDAFRADHVAKVGTPTAIVDEHAEAAAYRTIAELSSHAAAAFRLDFGRDRRVAGFRIDMVIAPTTRLDYRTHAHLRLPFAGAWTVAWGGRTLAQNYHLVSPQQRFAYDLVIARAGVTHAGDGTHNADYFAYGRPILAPAAGTVVTTVDGVAENVPGQMDAAHVFGNHVVIDLGDGEYAVLAHLIPGSLAVKVGDRVAAGQPIGACGNSGHSSEPHLHVHLQTSPRLDDGEGLPAPFTDYTADGAPVARGEPTRGQTIEPR